MKKILLILIGAAFSVAVDAGELERVYITTDRSCYVAGDDILMSAFCFDAAASENELSCLSATAYVELRSVNGVVQTSKLALLNGRGGGVMTIYPDLPTGNYMLTAYTSQNVSESGFAPYSRVLTIINAISTARCEGVSISDKPREISDDASLSLRSVVDGDAVSILNYTEYLMCTEGTLSLKNTFDEPVTFSVSVYADDSLASVSGGRIEEVAAGWKNLTGEIQEDYIPDYEGEILHLKVSSEVKPGTLVSLSRPGVNPELFFARVDSSSTVSIYTGNIFSDADVIFQLHSTDSISDWNVDFEEKRLEGVRADIPSLTLDPSMASRIMKRGVAMQLFRRFKTDTLYTLAPFRCHSILNHPDKVYQLDDYTRFPLITEVLTEYVPEMAVRRESGKPVIQLWAKDFSGQAFFSAYEPLILMDGMPVTDHSKLLSYDPTLVKSLDIYNSENLLCGIPCGGIANFRTYKDNLNSWNFDSSTRILHFSGASLPQKRIYNGGNASNPGVEYRYTLYWDPMMELEAGQNASVKVLMPSYPGSFKVRIEGVTASGKPFSTWSSFIVSSSKSDE